MTGKNYEVIVAIPIRIIVRDSVDAKMACDRAKAEADMMAEAKGIKADGYKTIVLSSTEINSPGRPDDA